jgi:subtilase family serine protease
VVLGFYGQTHVGAFGGTSVGAPQWAGLIAIADQLRRGRVGTINPTLYALAGSALVYSGAFHEVLTGDNSSPYNSVSGYPARRGYDLVTGLGSPRADRRVPLIAAHH